MKVVNGKNLKSSTPAGKKLAKDLTSILLKGDRGQLMKTLGKEEGLKPKKPYPGTRDGAGRPKGAPGKFTTLKKAFLDVFENVGGIERLELWVEEDPRNLKLFYTLIAKMLPREVTVNSDTEVAPGNLKGLKDEELDAIISGHAAER